MKYTSKINRTVELVNYLCYTANCRHCILVGNKCNQIPLSEDARDEVQEYVEQKCMLGYHEVSTETSENINELFQCLVKIPHLVQLPEGV